MTRFLKFACASTAMVAALGVTPALLKADEHRDEGRKYHDKAHNDDHEWNNNEDRAYRMWAKEKHRKEMEFTRLKESDQQAYWRWRHDHSDAVLKINIH